MQKLIEKFKKILNAFFWLLGGILALRLICYDLDTPGGGYLQFIFISIFSLLLSSYKDAAEILQTPLASLTIAKILALVWYALLSWFLFSIASGIWFFISEKLEEQQNKRVEKEREIQREEAKYAAQACDECATYVSAMENSQSLEHLNSLFYEAIGKWPRWEKQLSRVYKRKKDNLENTPV
ncbi:hypothetical protein [Candidatus Protochlamydia phocaeensis]|uniref:hypothetical protein n=1 Tax=Candidatus Protochlamydia phocaeensis TaxID=1414722 RepID=UPI000838C8AA|nr:hypothetical protein [Candidatus Protochlamydia phocaeensis]